ncbi:MAG: hypothetical protein VB861_02410, partial [Planctomycetaceae bacterium]
WTTPWMAVGQEAERQERERRYAELDHERREREFARLAEVSDEDRRLVAEIREREAAHLAEVSESARPAREELAEPAPPAKPSPMVRLKGRELTEEEKGNLQTALAVVLYITLIIVYVPAAVIGFVATLAYHIGKDMRKD